MKLYTVNYRANVAQQYINSYFDGITRRTEIRNSFYIDYKQAFSLVNIYFTRVNHKRNTYKQHL